MRFSGVRIWLLMLSMLPLAVSAQNLLDPVEIDSVVVTTSVRLQDIGVQKTHIDTRLLKENVTLSMADVLTNNSVIYIKSFGRSSLSTASFRGTAPSHTQVTWNGMKLNSPMLGMVDFSLIPSYFIDNVDLYHGASSTNVSSGGLGGAVALVTSAAPVDGWEMKYVQGVGSFSTYDQFLTLSYGAERWQSTTRVLYSSSQNDFEYRNYNKFKVPVLDGAGSVIGYEYPLERNRDGDFKDLHLMQEFRYNSERLGEFGVRAWLTDSRRGVPTLNVSYRDENATRARQNELTLRTVASWNKLFGRLGLNASAGYNYTDMTYVYSVDAGGEGNMVEAIHSQSYVNTFFAKMAAEYGWSNRLMFSMDVDFNQYLVDSHDKSLTGGVTGYRKGRPELSTKASIRWKPYDQLGLAVTLKEDLYGDKYSPLVPALFAEYAPWGTDIITFKGSATRNYRYPTLNDMYYLPGGNPELRPERGYTYDLGLRAIHKAGFGSLKGEITWFDSYIDDWILWRPTFKGFYTPLNINKVRSYGLEVKGSAEIYLARDWDLSLDALFTETHSINKGEPVSAADNSVGRQLPYVPVYSAAVSANLQYRSWRLTYKWNYYSERFTTSTNDYSVSGTISPYYMNDLSLSRQFNTSFAAVSLRFDVRNLFDEEYESVLSHPMPGRNYGLTIEITPRLGSRR